MCNRSTLSQTSIGCEYKATMASVENFRGFINETLNAAAEEIFRGFRNAVGEYEEEIDRLRRMLDFVSNPAGLYNIRQIPLWFCHYNYIKNVILYMFGLPKGVIRVSCFLFNSIHFAGLVTVAAPLKYPQKTSSVPLNHGTSEDNP